LSEFQRYIGIDYSGARTPDTPLPGLRVFMASRAGDTIEEVRPTRCTTKHWTRRGIHEWLSHLELERIPTLVAIDHGFSFPLRYFEAHGLRTWDEFLEDFTAHWPSDQDAVSIDLIRRGHIGAGPLRAGQSTWRRLTEERCGAKSVFHFDVPGSVAKSTHAGLPWLLHLRRAFPDKLHFWPFDGWSLPPGQSVITEAYPRLWTDRYPNIGRTPDQHDAYCLTRGLREADQDHTLGKLFDPKISPLEKEIATLEGWILGVYESSTP
jgi:hypothetical protein